MDIQVRLQNLKDVLAELKKRKARCESEIRAYENYIRLHEVEIEGLEALKNDERRRQVYILQ